MSPIAAVVCKWSLIFHTLPRLFMILHSHTPYVLPIKKDVHNHWNLFFLFAAATEKKKFSFFFASLIFSFFSLHKNYQLQQHQCVKIMHETINWFVQWLFLSFTLWCAKCVHKYSHFSLAHTHIHSRLYAVLPFMLISFAPPSQIKKKQCAGILTFFSDVIFLLSPLLTHSHYLSVIITPDSSREQEEQLWTLLNRGQ